MLFFFKGKPTKDQIRGIAKKNKSADLEDYRQLTIDEFLTELEDKIN